MLELVGEHIPVLAIAASGRCHAPRRLAHFVNRKRVYRLWRQQGLKVPRRKKKKRGLGQKQNGCATRRSLARNHVWAWDFIHDRTADGRPLKWVSVVDEYTRECIVGLEVARSMSAKRVTRTVVGRDDPLRAGSRRCISARITARNSSRTRSATG